MRTKRALTGVVLTMAAVAAACGAAAEDEAVGDPAAPITALAQTADEAALTASGESGGDAEAEGVVAGGATPSSALAVAASAAQTTVGSAATDGDDGATPSSGPSSTGITIRATTATTASTSTSSSGGTATTARGSTTSTRPSTSGPSTTARRATTTTARPTTTVAPTTSRPLGDGYFRTLPPGSALPSGDSCAARVKPRPETRAANASYNRTRGTDSNDWNPRVDGNFVGTTDEIIQWAACKWGIDEDWARAQAVKESWWDMTAGGDRTSDQSACYPAVRTSSGDCPESVGLLQVRYLYHGEAFEDGNALLSTAYNIDYTYAVWRTCYEGETTWLNTVERGSQYGAGDLEGCLGVWFSGRWHLPNSDAYIADVRQIRSSRVWEQADFLGHG